MKSRYLTLPCLLNLAFSGPAFAVTGTWTANLDGNWSDTTKWASATPADGAGFTANFTANITAARIVTLDSARTIGNVVFTDSTTSSNDLAVSGGNLLTLDAGVGLTPSINVTQAGRRLRFNSQLGGTQGFAKSGAGILELNVNNAATLSGNIAIDAGIVQVLTAGALGSGNVTLAGGTELHFVNAASTNFGTNLTLTASAAVSAAHGGTGAINHTAGTLSIGSTLSLNKFGATTSGGLAFGATTLTADATFATNTGTTLTLGATSGGFSITKSGAGALVLSGASSYSGSNNIVAGAVRISAATNLGDGSATNGIAFNTTPGGILQSTANSYALGTNRSVTLNVAGTIQVDAGQLTVDGNVTGPSSLTKAGLNPLELTGTNSYAGATNIANGLLIASGSSLTSGNIALGTVNNVFLYGTMGVNTATTFTRSVGTLTNEIRWVESGGFAANGSGTAFVNLGGSVTPATLTQGVNGFYEGSTAGTNTDSRLALGDPSSAGTIDFRNPVILNSRTLKVLAHNGSAAVDSVLSGDISGTGNGVTGFSKIGPGTTALTGTNTYIGNTEVSDGTLLVNGSITSAVSNTVNGTLGGTGMITGALTLSGKLAPGASIESLGTGTVSFLTGSSLVYEMNRADAGIADLVDSTGQLNLTGSVTISLTGADGSWVLGDKVTLISYFDIDGLTPGWNGGIFTGIADDSIQSYGLNSWLVNYDDTAGGTNFSGEQASGANARFVTMTVVPEPSMALLGAIGVFTILRRRR